MSDKHKLRYGPLSERSLHLCVDMQRMFAEDTDWKTPWMARVLPKVVQITEAHPDSTIFTRFIPATRPGEGEGTWKRYYERWSSMTIEQLGQDMIDLMPDLRRFVPPAEVIDKHVYSPWVETDLQERLKRRGVDTLVITGGETDVCVLATVLGAVDRGYRVIVGHDALCSSSDETHDASLEVYHSRYGMQVEAVTTDVILQHWAAAKVTA
ncbi:MAG TPA: isochorismatase family cysteine hydrolase [Geminicoccus sp.]|jgi:nicotinamidase-related amidase|uniref:cysteine hydrolase family protein n=1 Tax=Geminicoccus sp. TaxID=2024832 RepID=UPI002E36D09A|nr:isochorismatase family cysteine hydrolase [Geminicoccus sp.]HEX2529456.1 isochorismatase family cysteine hydrolase [Geminicoccus sp.]